MGGSSKKESNRADDIARQERERAAAQAAELRQQQEAAAAQLMREIEAAVAPSTQELSNQAALSRVQPERERLALETAQGGPALNTPLGLALQERLLADLNRNPDDTFAPNLELLKGEVGRFAANRGIVGSGLELEQLGRTGVELAIQQAQAREQQRSAQVNQAIQGNTALETIGASRRGELSDYEKQLQVLEDSRRGREISARTGASTTGAGIRQTGNLTALERINTGEGRALDIESTQLDADRKARAAQQAAIGQLVGTAAGAATMFIPGVGPVLAPMVQQGIGGAFGGGQQAGGGGMNPLILAGSSGTPPYFPPTQSGAALRAAQRKPSGAARGGYDEFYERFQ